ncbi:unnamed protein product [Amoebophrya sp. A120]|nr:unnamed protein product [Amoebophrya sp. A120]|eukprot:GSA120T00015161001.1
MSSGPTGTTRRSRAQRRKQLQREELQQAQTSTATEEVRGSATTTSTSSGAPGTSGGSSSSSEETGNMKINNTTTTIRGDPPAPGPKHEWNETKTPLTGPSCSTPLQLQGGAMTSAGKNDRGWSSSSEQDGSSSTTALLPKNACADDGALFAEAHADTGNTNAEACEVLAGAETTSDKMASKTFSSGADEVTETGGQIIRKRVIDKNADLGPLLSGRYAFFMLILLCLIALLATSFAIWEMCTFRFNGDGVSIPFPRQKSVETLLARRAANILREKAAQPQPQPTAAGGSALDVASIESGDSAVVHDEDRGTTGDGGLAFLQRGRGTTAEDAQHATASSPTALASSTGEHKLPLLARVRTRLVNLLPEQRTSGEPPRSFLQLRAGNEIFEDSSSGGRGVVYASSSSPASSEQVAATLPQIKPVAFLSRSNRRTTALPLAGSSDENSDAAGAYSPGGRGAVAVSVSFLRKGRGGHDVASTSGRSGEAFLARGRGKRTKAVTPEKPRDLSSTTSKVQHQQPHTSFLGRKEHKQAQWSSHIEIATDGDVTFTKTERPLRFLERGRAAATRVDQQHEQLQQGSFLQNKNVAEETPRRSLLSRGRTGRATASRSIEPKGGVLAEE